MSGVPVAWGFFLLLFAFPLSAQDIAPPPVSDDIGTYMQAIENAETLGGPYAMELVDLYYGFGQALLEEGDLKGARDAFHRTAMVSRVNSGPNSLDQTNYLYSIARVEALLGNFEESIKVLESIYSLHARSYGENNPEMLPVLQQINQWYEEQLPLSAPLTRSSDFENRSYLADRIAQLTQRRDGIGSVQTAERYRASGQLHFRSVYYMLQSGEPPLQELVFNEEQVGAQWYFQRSISAHFQEGEEAFSRVVDSWRQNPEGTALEVAEAIAQLGDWYLALQHFRSAEKQYEAAYQLLANSTEYSHIADDYFGSPSPLRFLNTEERFVRVLDAPVAIKGLEVSMTVTRNGRLIDVEVISAPQGESQEDLNRMKSQLEHTRFRPAVINGEVETTEDFVWRPLAIVPKIAARDP